jgi:multisubunit Na+/H+ antiporter MnhB subunit
VADVDPPPAAGPVLDGVTRLVVPVMVVVAGYLLWLGTHAPGGAFQSGAVLAAAGILLFMAGGRSIGVLSGRRLAAALVGGFVAFLLVGLLTMATGRALLDYPPGTASALIVAVELAVTVTIAVGLTTLFVVTRCGRGDA